MEAKLSSLAQGPAGIHHPSIWCGDSGRIVAWPGVGWGGGQAIDYSPGKALLPSFSPCLDSPQPLAGPV